MHFLFTFPVIFVLRAMTGLPVLVEAWDRQYVPHNHISKKLSSCQNKRTKAESGIRHACNVLLLCFVRGHAAWQACRARWGRKVIR